MLHYESCSNIKNLLDGASVWMLVSLFILSFIHSFLYLFYPCSAHAHSTFLVDKKEKDTRWPNNSSKVYDADDEIGFGDTFEDVSKEKSYNTFCTKLNCFPLCQFSDCIPLVNLWLYPMICSRTLSYISLSHHLHL